MKISISLQAVLLFWRVLVNEFPVNRPRSAELWHPPCTHTHTHTIRGGTASWPWAWWCTEQTGNSLQQLPVASKIHSDTTPPPPQTKVKREKSSGDRWLDKSGLFWCNQWEDKYLIKRWKLISCARIRWHHHHSWAEICFKNFKTAKSADSVKPGLCDVMRVHKKHHYSDEQWFAALQWQTYKLQQ